MQERNPEFDSLVPGLPFSRRSFVGASLAAAFAVYLLLSLAQRIYVNSWVERADRARHALDGPALRVSVQKLWPFAHPTALAPRLRLHHALGWMMEEQWFTALEELSTGDGDGLHLIDKAAWLGNRAFCRARTGNFDLGMTDAYFALETAKRSEEPASVAAQQGILGAILVMHGEASSALSYLQAAVTDGSGPGALVGLRQYFLGEAHHALGHAEAAQVAWRAAVQAGAPGGFGAQARARLEKTA